MITLKRSFLDVEYGYLKEAIKLAFPDGHFVAIEGDKIVGEAADFMTLYRALKAAGRDPARTMIVQAGHEYPEQIVTLVPIT